MSKAIDIETFLCPNKDKLNVHIEDGEMFITSSIVDPELDIINCKFVGGNCVEIDTEGYTYIQLTKANLHKLIDLIKKAETKFDNFYTIETK